MKLDPVDLKILQNKLVNICMEMATAMMRTSYSPIFSESLDFCNVILDRRGQLLAIADMNPAMLGSGVLSGQWILDEVGASEALGFRNGEWNVHVSLYLFEKQAQHAEASKALRQSLPAQGVYSNFSSNGPVLFVGHTPNDGSNGDPIQAKHRVARIASAFAGEE